GDGFRLGSAYSSSCWRASTAPESPSARSSTAASGVTRRVWRENPSSPGRAGRSLARTQGASISIDMGATEDTARGRAARSGGADFLRQTLLNEGFADDPVLLPQVRGRVSLAGARAP